MVTLGTDGRPTLAMPRLNAFYTRPFSGTMRLAALARLFERMPHCCYLVLDSLGVLHGTLNVQD
jgi:hypothetical protein